MSKLFLAQTVNWPLEDNRATSFFLSRYPTTIVHAVNVFTSIPPCLKWDVIDEVLLRYFSLENVRKWIWSPWILFLSGNHAVQIRNTETRKHSDFSATIFIFCCSETFFTHALREKFFLSYFKHVEQEKCFNRSGKKEVFELLSTSVLYLWKSSM